MALLWYQYRKITIFTIQRNIEFFGIQLTEATYAYKLGKSIVPLLLEAGYQPDGWLGILQGMDLYYEFYSNQQVVNNMDKLFKAIEECIGKTGPEDGMICEVL